MYIIVLYHKTKRLYDLSIKHSDQGLRDRLSRAFLRHRDNILRICPELCCEDVVVDVCLEENMDFLVLDNHNGEMSRDIHDSSLEDAVRDLYVEVSNILTTWRNSMNDPWIRECIDKPFDGYWESLEDKFGF